MPPKRKSENGEESESKTKKGRAEIPDISSLDFSCAAKTSDGKKWNTKLASWNVNGIRAWMEKNGQSYITKEKPDVFCLQETKCSTEKIPAELSNIDGYHVYWLSGDTEGYSGVGMYCKDKPVNVTYGIGETKHDKEGRVITAEFERYFMVTAYVPNAGRGLVRLNYRHKEWDPAFRAYLKKLDGKKPVVLCGDLNVAHQEIDLANPKSNKKNAGFTKEERDGFTELLDQGFVDSYRHLHPDERDKYSFWTYMMNARGKNKGWRLDYFAVSERLKNSLCESTMRTEVFGSDHCPIVCMMHI